jgi:hypothetical protein
MAVLHNLMVKEIINTVLNNVLYHIMPAVIFKQLYKAGQVTIWESLRV